MQERNMMEHCSPTTATAKNGNFDKWLAVKRRDYVFFGGEGFPSYEMDLN